MHAIVEQKKIRLQMLHREATALHTVLVHDHRDSVEIPGEHERFVARIFGIQQQGGPRGYHFGHPITRNGAVCRISPFLRSIESAAFVSAGKNGHTAAPVTERTRQQFDDRRLSRAAHGDIADGDHTGAEMMLGFPAAAVSPEPQLDEPAEDP